MRTPALLPALALALLVSGHAFGAAPEAASQGSALLAPVAAPADSQRIAAGRAAVSAAYREHAPLAFFSLGSLAVGGVFYAIGQGFDRPNVSVAAGDRSRVATVVSVAGISALLAAGSYFYYVHKAGESAEDGSDWEASVGGAPDGDGGISVAARLTLALPSIR